MPPALLPLPERSLSLPSPACLLSGCYSPPPDSSGGPPSPSPSAVLPLTEPLPAAARWGPPLGKGWTFVFASPVPSTRNREDTQEMFVE